MCCLNSLQERLAKETEVICVRHSCVELGRSSSGQHSLHARKQVDIDEEGEDEYKKCRRDIYEHGYEETYVTICYVAFPRV